MKNMIFYACALVVGVWMGVVVWLGLSMLESLQYIADSQDYLLEMMDMIWTELSWNLDGEFMIPAEGDRSGEN